VKAPYRRLTPELRAEHVAALAVLGRLVVSLPSDRLQWRRFVVVSVEPSRSDEHRSEVDAARREPAV
jgi:hypothetical protein